MDFVKNMFKCNEILHYIYNICTQFVMTTLSIDYLTPKIWKILDFKFLFAIFYMIICMLCSFLSFFICNTHDLINVNNTANRTGINWQ